jgi:hypothetical protein
MEVVHMSRLKLASYTDDVLDLYGKGMSARQIAIKFNTTTTTVTSLLIRHGAMPYVSKKERGLSSLIKKKKIVELYEQGFSPKAISEQGFCLSLVRESLAEFSVELRGQPKGKGAHPIANYVKGQITREINSSGIMPTESLVIDILCKNGISNITPQKAIGIYSCDLVIDNPRIAVECVCRGTASLYFKEGRATDKIKKFSKLGWHVYFLVAQDIGDVSFFGINDLIAWINFIKIAPTLRRQYRVFRCGTDLLACGCCDDDKLPSVWSF